MKFESEDLRQNIRKSVMIYIIGFCFFSLISLTSLWLGFYVIFCHNEYERPIVQIIISLGGGLLLWEIIKAFRIKTSLPKNFRLIREQEFPTLFSIISEITISLNLSPVRNVYICPNATAAVFIQPQLRNLFFEPQRYLVVGLGFLTQMDDDEIRAVLYHEFGHYAQEEMKSSISVYTIGQFSNSFIFIKELKKQGIWELQTKMQIMLFTYFTIWICNRINKAYSKLAKQMEYDADDVAVKYVGASTLQRALLHAACIRYNYEVVQWGMQQLKSQNIQVDNPYLALSFVGNYSRPIRRFLSNEVLKRVERLGRLEKTKSLATNSIRQSAFLLLESNEESQRLCSARQFALWLRQGLTLYTQLRILETSVDLEIHLSRKKHKRPLLDSSYKLLLDDKEIGRGNFIKGYTLRHKTSPGKHQLTAFTSLGIISTPFEFEVEQDKFYHIEMDYKYYIKDGVFDVFGKKITQM